MITCRMLLKSCAMPPVSWPTASIFCDWCKRDLGLGATLRLRFECGRAIAHALLEHLVHPLELAASRRAAPPPSPCGR